MRSACSIFQWKRRIGGRQLDSLASCPASEKTTRWATLCASLNAAEVEYRLDVASPGTFHSATHSEDFPRSRALP